MATNGRSFYSAHTILFIIAIIVCISTWIIPAGKYERLEYLADNKEFIIHGKSSDTKIAATQQALTELGLKIPIDNFIDNKITKSIAIPNSYYQLDSNPQGVSEFLQAPMKGFYGAIEIILFVLVIGGFIAIINESGAFNQGITVLAKKLHNKEQLLIIIVFVLTAAGGTTFGMAEETIAFLPILIPVFIAAGYDTLVPLATISLGSAAGTIGSTINPFSVIIASNAAGIHWTAGVLPRVAVLLIISIVILAYILRYAKSVKAEPERSLIYFSRKEHQQHFLKEPLTQEDTITFKAGLILTLFITTFAVMVYGVTSLGWWFLEMTTLFFTSALIIGFIAKFSELTMVNTFIRGAQDLLSVAIIIAIARGITVLMENGFISDTILYQSSLLVDGMAEGLFINMMFLINVGLGAIISSSSGLAVLTMPIFAPLADTVGIGRELIVSSYLYGFHLVQVISPTGLILASLAIAKIPFSIWLKFVMPLFFIILGICSALLTLNLYMI